FSSRRRHTRWPRDWSSDVCSSDLNNAFHVMPLRPGGNEEATGLLLWGGSRRITPDVEWFASVFAQKLAQLLRRLALSEGDRKQRSEERRVGKEWREGRGRAP